MVHRQGSASFLSAISAPNASAITHNAASGHRQRNETSATHTGIPILPSRQRRAQVNSGTEGRASLDVFRTAGAFRTMRMRLSLLQPRWESTGVDRT